MPIQIIIDQEPVSVNPSKTRGAKKQVWKTHLKAILKRAYPLPANQKTLFSKKQNLYFMMTYFYKYSHPDLDNIIKYTCDGFAGYAFPNDRKVQYFVSQCVQLKPNQITGFNIDNIPDDILNELLNFIKGSSPSANKNSRTYIECGHFNPNMIKYNLEQIWK